MRINMNFKLDNIESVVFSSLVASSLPFDYAQGAAPADEPPKFIKSIPVGDPIL